MNLALDYSAARNFVREDFLISRMAIAERVLKLKSEVSLSLRNFSDNTLHSLLSKYLFFSPH